MNRSIYRIVIFLFFLITVVSYGQLTKDIGKQIQMDYAAFRAS